MDACTARSAAARAGRCYWVAHAYLAGGKWGEAEALFERAQARVAEASESLQVCGARGAAGGPPKPGGSSHRCMAA